MTMIAEITLRMLLMYLILDDVQMVVYLEPIQKSFVDSLN